MNKDLQESNKGQITVSLQIATKNRDLSPNYAHNSESLKLSSIEHPELRD